MDWQSSSNFKISSSHGFTISSFPASPDPDDLPVVHPFRKRRRRLEHSGICGTHAIHERPRIAADIPVQHQAIVTHIDVIRRPIGFVRQPDRQPGESRTTSASAAAGSTPSLLSAGGCSSSTASTPPGSRSTTAICGNIIELCGSQANLHQELFPDFRTSQGVPLHVQILANDLHALTQRGNRRVAIESCFVQRVESGQLAFPAELNARGVLPKCSL